MPPGELPDLPVDSDDPFAEPSYAHVKEIRIEEHLQRPLGHLIKLKTEGHDLVLDRDHWATAFAGKSMPEITQEVTQLLGEYGIACDKANRNPGLALDHKSHLELLFDNLQSYAEKLSPGTSTTRNSGPRQYIRKRFIRDDMVAMIHANSTKLKLDFRAGDDIVRVTDLLLEDGPTLRITLVLDDAITRFERKADGSVQFLGVKGDQIASVSAASFTELCAQHPEEVEKHLLGELKRAGIVVPEVGPPTD